MSDQSLQNEPLKPQVTPESIEELDRKLVKLQDHQNDIERDMATDRKDLGNMRIDMGKFSQQIEEMRGEVTRLQTKTQDAIHAAVQNEMEPVRKQMNQMQETLGSFVESKKKIIYFQPDKGIMAWIWKRIKKN